MFWKQIISLGNSIASAIIIHHSKQLQSLFSKSVCCHHNDSCGNDEPQLIKVLLHMLSAWYFYVNIIWSTSNNATLTVRVALPLHLLPRKSVITTFITFICVTEQRSRIILPLKRLGSLKCLCFWNKSFFPPI